MRWKSAKSYIRAIRASFLPTSGAWKGETLHPMNIESSMRSRIANAATRLTTHWAGIVEYFFTLGRRNVATYVGNGSLVL